MELKSEVKQHRKQEHHVDPLFLNRWSPRAMNGEHITDAELMRLFEAARWAPSSYNNQPWRFVYAQKGTHYWQKFFDLLVEFNQQWCKNAAVLVVVISRKTFEHNGQPSITHSFDTGAAWENLALEGSLMNLVVHGMQGFDYDKAKKVFDLSDDYNVEMMFAVGKPGKKEDLPKEIQEREIPSDRKPLNEIIFEGEFMGK
ncbi:nitroreductase family protein [Candidatus Woesearchaeota archaeon]|nr:nitroreductase family protein [Candidatus Woesearchaeota archaeon]